MASNILQVSLNNLEIKEECKSASKKSTNPKNLDTFDQKLWLKENYVRNTNILPPDSKTLAVVEEPPGTIYLPEPFVSTCTAHVHINGNSVSYKMPGRTQWMSFIGHITMRIQPQFASTDLNMPVRIATQMWVAENDVIFRVIPGPIYTTSVPTAWPANMMAKAEFSKPLSFTRPVKNLTIGIDIVSVTNRQGEDIGYMSESGLPIGDLILDVFWRNADWDEEDTKDEEYIPFPF